jgi:hypothetical protein
MRHAGEVRGHSNGERPGSKHWYRRVWSGSKWDEFVETRSVGEVVQICTGGSLLGRVRVDLLATGAENVRADYHALPLRSDSCDTVVCDPPYSLTFPDRIHLQRELARVARRRILFKAPWLCRATGWSLGETVLLASHTCANVAILSVLDHVHVDQLSLSRG